jgi:hypothetical protein
MGDGTATGTRAAITPWLTLFLLLACGFPLSLRAQSLPCTIHVFVALADNKNQGIVPVAAILGNGEDPQHNLYWGSAYGH